MEGGRGAGVGRPFQAAGSGRFPAPRSRSGALCRMKLMATHIGGHAQCGLLACWLFLWPLVCQGTAPELRDIQPTGGQRGTELEVSFVGDRLQDAEEVLCY